ncbi:hypothetical protein PoB_006867400 [Plakobranchus ocellatus]|uniref:Uncharacterized protein n=1 Tax=Plakobranchus ocellatus TaxID=259542 RepID=A0AAV4DDA1_9GAST|nr:hypothetical protein PoB_006867400 [Plakobranchus ocellatus]
MLECQSCGDDDDDDDDGDDDNDDDDDDDNDDDDDDDNDDDDDDVVVVQIELKDSDAAPELMANSSCRFSGGYKSHRKPIENVVQMLMPVHQIASLPPPTPSSTSLFPAQLVLLHISELYREDVAQGGNAFPYVRS